MSFKISWPNPFSPLFLERAKTQLTLALNGGKNLPDNIVGEIRVTQLVMGSRAPELEILEIGELLPERFKGMFKLLYSGDAYIVVQTLVQANPLSSTSKRRPSSLSPSQGMLLAHKPLLVPLELKISRLSLKGVITLVVDKQEGVTLVFKSDPLESVVVSSSFDSVSSIKKLLQRQIEAQLRGLFQEELPQMIHNLSKIYTTPSGSSAGSSGASLRRQASSGVGMDGRGGGGGSILSSSPTTNFSFENNFYTSTSPGGYSSTGGGGGQHYHSNQYIPHHKKWHNNDPIYSMIDPLSDPSEAEGFVLNRALIRDKDQGSGLSRGILGGDSSFQHQRNSTDEGGAALGTPPFIPLHKLSPDAAAGGGGAGILGGIGGASFFYDSNSNNWQTSTSLTSVAPNTPIVTRPSQTSSGNNTSGYFQVGLHGYNNNGSAGSISVGTKFMNQMELAALGLDIHQAELLQQQQQHRSSGSEVGGVYSPTNKSEFTIEVDDSISQVAADNNRNSISSGRRWGSGGVGGARRSVSTGNAMAVLHKGQVNDVMWHRPVEYQDNSNNGSGNYFNGSVWGGGGSTGGLRRAGAANSQIMPHYESPSQSYLHHDDQRHRGYAGGDSTYYDPQHSSHNHSYQDYQGNNSHSSQLNPNNHHHHHQSGQHLHHQEEQQRKQVLKPSDNEVTAHLANLMTSHLTISPNTQGLVHLTFRGAVSEVNGGAGGSSSLEDLHNSSGGVNSDRNSSYSHHQPPHQQQPMQPPNNYPGGNPAYLGGSLFPPGSGHGGIFHTSPSVAGSMYSGAGGGGGGSVVSGGGGGENRRKMKRRTHTIKVPDILIRKTVSGGGSSNASGSRNGGGSIV